LAIEATPYYNLRHSFKDFKDETSPEVYRTKFFEICDYYKDYFRLYAGGSRVEDRVAAAVVHKNIKITE